MGERAQLIDALAKNGEIVQRTHPAGSLRHYRLDGRKVTTSQPLLVLEKPVRQRVHALPEQETVQPDQSLSQVGDRLGGRAITCGHLWRLTDPAERPQWVESGR
ncbi:MAG: hypothetical protein E6G94_02385 [Alphaproteobacteria bacterium]|nr:MAG: hypothetical protein E6G94_02385 [Alphaproteobacteria bacterium]